MAGSFTSVHAFNKKALPKEAIIQRFDDFYFKTGYELAHEDENADANIYIFYKSGDPWVTVYEDTCDELSMDELADCVKRFSGILAMPIAVGNVYDGEEASFAYGDSRTSENIVVISDADEKNDFGGRFRFSVPPAFERIVPFLKKPMDKYKVYKVWRSSYRYPEEKLAAFTRLFGINFVLATCGYRIYDQRFRRRGVPFVRDYCIISRCYKRRENAAERREAFLPMMEAVSYDNSISAGKEFHASFCNTTDFSRGLIFYVFGKAIDESIRSGQTRAEHVKVVYRDYDGAEHSVDPVLDDVDFVNGTKGLCVKLDAVELVKEEPIDFCMTLKNLPSSGECVRVAVMPMENPKAGQCVVKIYND